MSAFSPPTPEQLSAHLAQHPPRAPVGAYAWAPFVPLALLVMLGFAAGGAAAVILPWVGVLGLMAFLSFRVRRARTIDSAVSNAQELALLRRYPQALRKAWLLLPQTTQNPILHARTVSLLAHCLDHVGAYDSAMIAYDFLLDHLPDNHPTTLPLRVQRAHVALLSDHLVDADASLRRLRGTPADEPGTPLFASYRFAQLVQHVRTNHFDDAVREFPNLVEDLRPLSIDAGYGYGLMALCHFNSRSGTDGTGRSQARRWWDGATLLLPPRALTGRFPELAPVAAAMREDGP